MGQKLGRGAAECFGGPPSAPGPQQPTSSPALGLLRTESAVERFQHHCAALQQLVARARDASASQPPLEVSVRRGHLVDDILRIPEFNGSATSDGLLGRKLKVNFVGEAGIDDTGLTTDFFVSAVHAFLTYSDECDLGVDWVALSRAPSMPFYIGQRVLLRGVQSRIAAVGAEIQAGNEQPAAEAAAEDTGAMLSKTTTADANVKPSTVLDIDIDTRACKLRLASGFISWLPFDNIVQDPNEPWPNDGAVDVQPAPELSSTPSGNPPSGWIPAEQMAVFPGMRLRYTDDSKLPEVTVVAAEQHGSEMGFRTRSDDGLIRWLPLSLLLMKEEAGAAAADAVDVPGMSEILSMGFAAHDARAALELSAFDVPGALELLLSGFTAPADAISTTCADGNIADSTRTNAVWQWMQAPSHLTPQIWNTMESTVSLALESAWAAYQANGGSGADLACSSYQREYGGRTDTYFVDFREMTQKNTRTGTVCAIRRQLAGSHDQSTHTQEAEGTPYWFNRRTHEVRRELPIPAAEQLGRADRQMPSGTTVLVEGKGRGVICGWKRNIFGPNDHHIEFEHGREIVKLRNERWHALLIDDNPSTDGKPVRLFTDSAADNYVSSINPDSHYCRNYQQLFRTFGTLLAKAVVDGVTVEAWFNVAFYKDLLGLPLTIEDLAAVDYQEYNSLRHVETASAEDIQNMLLVFGHGNEELCFGGMDLEVDLANRSKFIQMKLDWLLRKRVYRQRHALRLGFAAVLPTARLLQFGVDDRELELLLCGIPTIDVEDWRLNSEHRSWPHKPPERHPTCQLFWEVVRSLDEVEKAALLRWVTGSPRVPAEGFSHLRGAGGVCRFKLQFVRWPLESLPCAHTCDNRIDLPAYKTADQLRHKIEWAIAGSQTFDNS